MNLVEALAAQGLSTVLIIDDAYDESPLASDLNADEEAWSTFMDDVNLEREAVLAVFPKLDDVDGRDLRNDNDFVEAIWKAKGAISEELWSQLFSGYEQATRSDRKFLETLELHLAKLGLTVIRSGRKARDNELSAQIIFADLFLGAHQASSDIVASTERLKPLIDAKPNSPPLVILMSRSNVLHKKKPAFRDDTGVLGALFRAHHKTELEEQSIVERALQRLVDQRLDALKIANFLDAWSVGMSGATERFLKTVRRLDLADYVQVRHLLLTYEGQSLGSYMLDVFDRVHQYEIEGDKPTILAADSLSAIQHDRYLAPNIAGSPDLQDLVEKTIWQNPQRLNITSAVEGAPVEFGDVLIRKALRDGGQRFDPDLPDVLAVLTPPCDLIRAKPDERIVFITGEIEGLTPKAWSKRGDARTPIITVGEKRMRIDWHLKDLRTVQSSEVRDMLNADGKYQIARRFRMGHALELQQRVLSGLGRVGLTADMPATFHVQVTAEITLADETRQLLDAPLLESEGGVCYVAKDDTVKLVLTEPAIDQIEQALLTLKAEGLSQKAKNAVKNLMTSNTFAADLHRGLPAPKTSSDRYQTIKTTVIKADRSTVADQVIGAIALNPAPENSPDAAHAAIVLTLRDDT